MSTPAWFHRLARVLRTTAQGLTLWLPGTVLAGGFTLTSRKTYGHLSDGMICAEDELGIGTDHNGIIVLPQGFAGFPRRIAALFNKRRLD